MAHVLEALHLKTGRQVYREVFEFWLKIFGVIRTRVVSGIVMGSSRTNWSVLSRMSGPSRAASLVSDLYAFYLEASFFGILSLAARA